MLLTFNKHNQVVVIFFGSSNYRFSINTMSMFKIRDDLQISLLIST